MQVRSAHHELDGRQRRRLGGFTLLEVLLVLTLLIVLTAVSWPALDRLIARQGIERAVSDVQLLLTSARVRATDSGVTYQFRYEVGGRRYLLIPSSAAELVAAAETPGADIMTVSAAAWKRTGQLPEHVSFGIAGEQDVTDDPIAPELLSGLLNSDELSRASWGPAVLFHPDGTASDSTFIISDDGDESITITVRGLTGASRSFNTVVEERT